MGLPLARHGDDQTFCSFSIDLVRDPDGPAMPIESADLLHRRMRHNSRESMVVLRKVPDKGVENDGYIAACDVSAIGKREEHNQPKWASYDVQRLRNPTPLCVETTVRRLHPIAL